MKSKKELTETELKDVKKFNKLKKHCFKVVCGHDSELVTIEQLYQMFKSLLNVEKKL